jgi:hypothetical protein
MSPSDSVRRTSRLPEKNGRSPGPTDVLHCWVPSIAAGGYLGVDAHVDPFVVGGRADERRKVSWVGVPGVGDRGCRGGFVLSVQSSAPVTRSNTRTRPATGDHTTTADSDSATRAPPISAVHFA